MDSVAAIVVTYNRKLLLGRCLRAILSQTRPCGKVFVIDNASTDGTEEFLTEQGLLGGAIELVHLPRNTGSAGGFHEGMKRAHLAGFDWLWLMDDDGFPASNCLERLLSGRVPLDVVGPVAVLPDDPSRLTWKLRRAKPNGRYEAMRRIETYDELLLASSDGTYLGFATLFNGVLISRRVTEAIGYVLADLFIWGDENEYMLRCKAAGFRIGMRVEAFHFHPYVRPRHSSPWKFYYLYRNTMYMHWKYARITHARLLRPIYPVYMSARLSADLPSLSPPYLVALMRGAWRALQGELIGFDAACAGRIPATASTSAVRTQ
jgi:rhamnopyranosyl-N-acetylglucosaminyl-diphospho-decaprenol beta-1,3/1,4-galactofuranosyltransferase